MTPNNPTFISPDSPPSDDSVNQTPKTKVRPNPEKVSPSQHGRFLGAMDTDGKKTVKKPVPATTDEAATGGGTVFGLSSSTTIKNVGAVEDALERDSEGLAITGGKKSTKNLINPGFLAAQALPGQKTSGAMEDAIGVTSLSGITTKKPTKPFKEQEFIAAQGIASQEAYKGAFQKAETLSPEGTTQAPLPKVVLQMPDASVSQVENYRSDANPKSPQAPQGIKTSPALSDKKTPAALQRGDISQAVQKRTTPQVAERKEAPQTLQERTIPQAAPLFADIGRAAPAEKTPQPPQALHEVIQQTIDAMNIMRTKDESTTTVLIKQPPMFAGATLQIVESKSAKGEFNITFDNLSPDARRLIESQTNQTSLQKSLLDHGYTLRNVVIAPEVTFNPLPTNTPTTPREGKSSGRQGSYEGFDEDTNNSRK